MQILNPKLLQEMKPGVRIPRIPDFEDFNKIIWDNSLDYEQGPSDELIQLLQDCLLKINSRPNRHGNHAPLAQAIHNLYSYALKLEGNSKGSQAPVSN
jgi:hypothetical protein